MQSRLTLANMLTSFRFVSAPLLLVLAWFGYGNYFLILLALTFLTDVLDGMAARLLNQQSEFGALLDSWADILIYATLAVSAWWLWPDIVLREKFFVFITVLSYLLPVGIGIYKFHAFTSYHTWLVKIAAALMGCSVFILALFNSHFLFRLAAVICLIAALEEILISCYLKELHSNVRSFWHVVRDHSKKD